VTRYGRRPPRPAGTRRSTEPSSFSPAWCGPGHEDHHHGNRRHEPHDLDDRPGVPRISVDKSGRERSPEEQHADNEQAAAEHGWALGDPYRDVRSASRYCGALDGT
jgi:hypothetical protein